MGWPAAASTRNPNLRKAAHQQISGHGPRALGAPTRISADPMCSTAEQARHHESLSCGSPLPALIATGSHPLKTKASQTTQNELKDSFIQSVDMTSYDLSMGFLLDYLHIYMIFLLVSYDISLRFLWV